MRLSAVKLLFLGLLLSLISPAFSQVNGCGPGSCNVGTSSSTPPVVIPTIISCAGRTQMNWSAVASSLEIATGRVFDFSNETCQNPYFEYFNGWVNTGVSNGPQEVGSGSDSTLHVSFTANANATLGNTTTGYTQASANSAVPATYTNALNCSVACVYIRKVNNGNNPPTLDLKTYAQMQADGGSISSSGASGGTTNDTIRVPDLYLIQSDPTTGVTFNAGVAYMTQIDEIKPVKLVPTAGTSSGTTATLTVADTSQWHTGNQALVTGMVPSGYNVALATLTVIDSTHVSYTTAGSNLGALSTFGNVDAQHIQNINAQSTTTSPNPFGDIYLTRTGTAAANVFQKDWGPAGSNVNPALNGDGGLMLHALRIMGTNPDGKLFVGLYGPSTGLGTGDNSALGQNNLNDTSVSSITGTTLTLGGTPNTPIMPKQTVSSLTAGIPLGTLIVSQLSGTTGGVTGATFQLNNSIASFSGAINFSVHTAGDSKGGLGYKRRALNAMGYSYVSTDVAGTGGSSTTTYGGNTVRIEMITGAAAVMTEMAQNDILGSYTAFLAALNPLWIQLENATPTKRLVLIPGVPTTTASAGNFWKNIGPGNQTQAAPSLYPTGYFWLGSGGAGTGYYADLLAGNLPSTGTKGVLLDLTQAYADATCMQGGTLAVPGTFDGYLPADGVTYFLASPDGGHQSSVSNACVGSKMAPNLATVLGFSP